MKPFCFIAACVLLVTYTECENKLIKRESFITRDETSRMVIAVNDYARRQMIDMLPGEMEDIRATYQKSSQKCSEAISSAVKKCETCMKDQQKLHNNPCVFLIVKIKEFVELLKKWLTNPVAEAGKLVEDIVGKFKGIIDNLGKDSVKFLNDLGKFTVRLGDDLLKGAGKIVQNSVDGLKRVGEDLVNLSEDVSKAVGTGVHDLGKGIGKTLDGLGRETSKLMKGIGDVTNDIGKGLENAAKEVIKAPHVILKPVSDVLNSVSRTVSGWFGKRDLERMRRICSVKCDICDKLDSKKHSKEQIISNICGSQMNALESRVLRLQQNLKSLFDILSDSIKDNFSIIKSIRYDRDSDYEEDAYMVNYITYEINNKAHEFKSKTALDTWNLSATGKSIGEQIMDILRNNDFSQA